jgi:hypothetical protein
MRVYMFQAALLCEDCGAIAKIERKEYEPRDPEDESSFDSDHYPKGPYADGGGEADCPQHCDSCGLFLENPLTPDGDAYVREQAAEFQTAPDMSWSEIAEAASAGGKPVLAEWIIYYFAWGR